MTKVKVRLAHAIRILHIVPHYPRTPVRDIPGASYANGQLSKADSDLTPRTQNRRADNAPREEMSYAHTSSMGGMAVKHSMPTFVKKRRPLVQGVRDVLQGAGAKPSRGGKREPTTTGLEAWALLGLAGLFEMDALNPPDGGIGTAAAVTLE